MASYTPNYNLKKPADADSYDIADANGNMDIIDGALNTIHPTTQLDTMSDLVSLISASASGLFVNCRVGSTIVNKLCGISGRQGTINAFKANASSDYIEYTVIDTEAVVYSGFYKISTDTATYNKLALNSQFSKLDWYKLTDQTLLTNGYVTINTYDSRKISDYDVLLFTFWIGSWICGSEIVIRQVFVSNPTVGAYYLTTADNMSVEFDIKPKTDTSFEMKYISSYTGNLYIRVDALKIHAD